MNTKRNFIISIGITAVLLIFLAWFYLFLLISNQSQEIYRFLEEYAKLEASRMKERMDNGETISSIASLWDKEIFDGEGYFHLIDTSGNILIHSPSPRSDPSIQNIFSLSYKKEEQKEQLIKNLEKEKEGIISFHIPSSKIQKVGVYVPIQKYHLFILVVVTQEYLNDKFIQTILLAIFFWLTTISGLLLLLIYIHYLEENNKNQIRKMRYLDTVSGKMKNKDMLELGEEMVPKSVFRQEILKGLKEGEFIVYFQPQADASTQKWIGAEALIRWNSKKYGFMPPDKFIPFCETEDIISFLDFYILEEILKNLENWKEKNWKISFNQSILTLYGTEYISQFKRILRKYKWNNDFPLIVEITESSVVDNKDRVMEIIENFHDLGILVAMDDFGSGYSSFNILKNLKLDIIKLDKELMDDFSNSIKERVILESILLMSKKLKMKTVAEGIETKEQAMFLKSLDCDFLQGYYYSKPIPLEKFLKGEEESK